MEQTASFSPPSKTVVLMEGLVGQVYHFNFLSCLFCRDVSDDVILCRSGAYSGNLSLCDVTLTGLVSC